MLLGGSPGISEMEPKGDEGPKETTSGAGKIHNEEEKMNKPEVVTQKPDSPETQNPETETKTFDPPKK